MNHDDLPDLLSLDLEDLRRVDHPVLRELVDELRDRASRPRQAFWVFDSAM
ncbi:FxSxx-COOH cyclophane-containing RiPP peptide [Streptomyces acidiscabies]|uniref:FxSxx-COOH protein n=1 Tax=Streptomyces acidiscabies TaxID=42234 RepID=A0AAP6B9K9_9ACTN|nr:FxSxx-COOH cyclophane-containing RiPP peptide [Streptomyces acidiscabies]MBP5936989.1 FXSXX-COOH protein [Streptomyces sp. LBUM 1476]MBZ3914972.1 FXSXX-COOH protein [Streptomyces acidiscabies]MDX2960578.1 FxSxx-COOH protein [Streptomyces acidiscabies]MDX3024018.1 FxSxx-COOH protein [Streptomyces acidiscabies]MDX3793752.1 FxSxx-COOH protein [Streptomyces acidiscabies]